MDKYNFPLGLDLYIDLAIMLCQWMRPIWQGITSLCLALYVTHLLIQLNSREKGRHFKKRKPPNQTLQTHQTHHMGKGLAWVQDVVPLPIPMQTHGPNPMGMKTPAIHYSSDIGQA